MYRLARYDAAGPWNRIADGIAVSGIQQTYPVTDPDYAGLLPDSFNLRGQIRNAANINPATVLAPALRALAQPLIYDFHALPNRGLRLHAPGEILGIEESAAGVKFTVRGWSPRPYYAVVHGLRQTPQVRVNGAKVALSEPHEYQVAAGRVILRLEGQAVVELSPP